MKNNQDIENQLENLKSGYRVPKDYFDNLEINFEPKRKKHSLLKPISKWMIAASVLLFVGMGYVKLRHTDKIDIRRIDTIEVTQKTSKQADNQLFNDISDDEIIDYLSDENDLDELNIN